MATDDLEQRLNEVTGLAIDTAEKISRIEQMLGAIPQAPQPNIQKDKPITPPFAEPHYRDKYLLRITEYKDYLIQYITDSGLSNTCRSSLKNFVNGYFDSTVFLSNNTDSKVNKWFSPVGNKIERHKLLFEINLIELRVNYDALDARSSNLSNIENMIRAMFQFILSSTEGDKRVGLIQYPHISAEKERITEFGAPPQQEEQKRKGLFG